MTTDPLIPLADLSERILLQDLATLAALRAEVLAMEEEIAVRRAKTARELALLRAGGAPLQQAHIARWQAEDDLRLRRIEARKLEIAAEEERARSSALEAFGRSRAVDLLMARAKRTRQERTRRRMEQDGAPI